MRDDSSVTLSELKETVKKFCEERDWDQFHSGKDLAIGLVTEASELLELFRFQREATRVSFEAEGKITDLEDEMADTLFFLLRLAQRWNVDLVGAFERKMAKNDKRYPASEFRGKNHKAP
jgi:NTP pyrophosphatase (non-canonical NTP hydrolase)